MTTRRGKVYDLPIGRFFYTHSPLDFYPAGIDRIENADKTLFLMASPEKALCDKLVFTQKKGLAVFLNEEDVDETGIQNCRPGTRRFRVKTGNSASICLI
jgi:hypothetical protein